MLQIDSLMTRHKEEAQQTSKTQQQRLQEMEKELRQIEQLGHIFCFSWSRFFSGGSRVHMRPFFVRFPTHCFNGTLLKNMMWLEDSDRIGQVEIDWASHLHFALWRKGGIPKKPRDSTKNGGTEPLKAVLGVGFPLDKPYSLHRWVPPFEVPEIFDDINLTKPSGKCQELQTIIYTLEKSFSSYVLT